MDLTQRKRSRLTLTGALRGVKSLAWLLLLAAATAPLLAQVAEQTETGKVTAGDGTTLSYSIRLLPLASFPELPGPVVRMLTARGCLIPQTYEAHEPENVVRGAFEHPESNDWAVLCSVHGTTTLLVFFASRPGAPAALASSKNTEWLAIEGDRVRGFAWGIDPAPPSSLPRGLAATHDGISDAFIEHTAKLHYFTDGRWLTIDRGDE